jgi:fructose transport system substrate-binding protein
VKNEPLNLRRGSASDSPRLPRRTAILAVVALVGAVVAAAVASAGTSTTSASIKVGLITKTESNPFFVKMREGAQQSAKKLGAQLLTAAGKTNTDSAAEITNIENMVSAGVKAILITPIDKTQTPAILKARKKGVLVIALDTPTDPASAADALFATDNFKAGLLVGKYAKAAMKGKAAKIATLDVAPGATVGVLRHDGFLKGFGIGKKDKSVVCSQDSGGDQAKGQTVMETCLQKDPEINLVYAVNEPAALGAYRALKKAGKEKGVVIVAIDGGCTGVRNVKAGVIAATAQQYPLKMAALGVQAGVSFAKTGKKVSGYTDTGVNLITAKAVAGVPSKGAAFGLANCWG